MTQAILEHVQKIIRDRDGAKALSRRDVTEQIRMELGDLAQEDPRRMGAASLRVDASRAAHDEAREASVGTDDTTLVERLAGLEDDTPAPPTKFDPRRDAWPDLLQGGDS